MSLEKKFGKSATTFIQEKILRTRSYFNDIRKETIQNNPRKILGKVLLKMFQ